MDGEREIAAAVPGEVPPAYIPGSAQDPAHPHDHGAGGQPERALNDEKSGKGRKLEYPPAPEPLRVPVFDNHAHLDFRDGQVAVTVQQHLDAAAAVGVAGAICVGYDRASSEFSVTAAATDPRLKAAVALHPNDAPVLAEQGEYQNALARIEELTHHDHVVAVGETGLDYFRTGESGVAAQKRSFYDHIALASSRGLAMQVHDRDAHQDVVEVLREPPELPRSVIFHCFSGDVELARICNENGWYMSFAGTVTFKNAGHLREALAAADPQLILVETDTPFLAPHPYRGRPNAPYLVPQTMRLMAQVRSGAAEGEELERQVDRLCQQVMFNTIQAYGDWL